MRNPSRHLTKGDNLASRWDVIQTATNKSLNSPYSDFQKHPIWTGLNSLECCTVSCDHIHDIISEPRDWGGGGHCLHELVVDGAEGGDGGGQSAGQQLGRLPVVLRFGPQQGHNVLQVAGRLQAQSVHHVAQVICGVAETGD